MDSIVAMFSRNFPSPETEAGRTESQKHVRNFVKRFPELAGLLSFSDEQVMYHGQPAHAVSIPTGSGLPRVMEAFGARVALALYRSQFGEPAPATAAIHSSWHPNAHLDNDETVEALLKAMGPVRTIRNGKWHVADQFRYWAAVPVDDPGVFCCFAAFRQSFGILSVVDPAGSRYEDDSEPYRPGFLQGFVV